MKKIIMHIDGMTCTHCKMRVEKALQAVDGVDEVMVDLGKMTAEVTVRETASNDILVNAVQEAGYRVKAIS